MSEPYEDKFRVAHLLEKFLESSPDENAAYLLPRFKWLLRVWNTNKDYAYPSKEEYDPDEDADDE